MKHTNKISGIILMILLFINITGYLFYKNELQAVDKKPPTTHCLSESCGTLKSAHTSTYNYNIKLKYEKIAFVAFFVEGFIIVGWNEIVKRNK